MVKEDNVKNSTRNTRVEQRNSEWILSNEDIEVKIDLSSMAAEVLEKTSQDIWSMMIDGYRDLLPKVGGFVRAGGVSLAEAVEKEAKEIVEEGLHGVEIRLSTFRPTLVGAAHSSVHVKFMIPDRGASLVVDVAAPDESPRTFAIKECCYPRPFILGKSPKAYTVLPIQQGCIIPANQPQVIHQRYQMWGIGGFYMPWFGAVREKSGYIAIIETPYDVEIGVDHTAEDGTSVTIHWLPSKGYLRYPRRVTYTFKPAVSYVDLAKHYRQYSKKIGRFRSLEDKIKENPEVSKLIGAIFVSARICIHDLQKKPVLHKVTSFQERMKQVEMLKELGVKKALIHVAGWGQRGYDNLHPDFLPPNKEAGGWEGLREFCNRTKQLGYLFCLHDQYRDFYLDAPSFSVDLCLKDETGEYTVFSAWMGGPQSVLCAAKALDFVKRNFEELMENGVKFNASYLDVFTCIPLEECYDPKHPMSRTECEKYRAEIFKYVRSLGIVLGSEEGNDWAIPYIDYPARAGPPKHRVRGDLGVPVPLYSLVYHDAIVVPWRVNAEKSYLRCLLYGGVPWVSFAQAKKGIEWFIFLANIHEHIGKDEMTDHKFLSDDYSIEETTYSSGVKITVDFESGTYIVKGIPAISGRPGTLLS